MDNMAFPIMTETDLHLPLYLEIIGHWDNQEAIERPQGFPKFQWLQVVSGEGELFIGDKRYTVKAGQGFCLFPDVPHSYHSLREPWDVYFISFGGSLSAEMYRQAGIEESGVYSTADSDIIISHLRNIYAMTQSDRSFLGLECSKLVYMFLLDLMKVILVSSHSVEQSYSKLYPVIQYIEANVDRVITIADLSECIGVTPQYLCLLFKKTMRMRPMEYVNRERVNRSKEIMFNQSEHKMHEVARMVGFDSASYFSSVFKKLEGLSPEQFKKIHGMR